MADTDSSAAESPMMTVESSEMLEVIEDFVNAQRDVKSELEHLEEDMKQDQDKVIKNTVCIEELLRDWSHDEDISKALLTMQQHLQEQKDQARQRHMAISSMRDEVQSAKAACLQGIKLLHGLLQDLHNELKGPMPYDTATPPNLPHGFEPLNTAFPAAHNDGAMMGIISDVFKAVPSNDVRPSPPLIRMDIAEKQDM